MAIIVMVMTHSHRLLSGFATALMLALALPAPAPAAPALDPRFGEQGLVRTPLPESLQREINFTSRGPLLEDLALQRDGRMVGLLASGTEFPFIGAVRYLRGGRLDPSFGDGGVASLGLGVSKFDVQGQAIVVQPDRRILLAGFGEDSRRLLFPFLARLRPDGTPDRSFGRQGRAFSRVREKNGLALHGVAVQRNGRIVAVGTRNERKGGKPAGVVIAYRPDGRVDRRFGRNGRVAFPHRRDGYTALRDIEILPGGKMLVTGYLGERLFIAKLWPDGRLDRSFGGGDGRVIRGIGFGACCPSSTASALAPGGKIVVLAAPSGGTQRLLRLFPNGKLDRSFGRRGAVAGRFIQRVGEAADLAIQSNGRIAVVGTSGQVRADDSNKRVFTLVRVLPNGRRDRSFAKNGVKRLPFGYNSTARVAVTLPNGSVLVGGGAQLLNPPGIKDEAGFEVKFAYDLALARLRR